MVKKICYIVGAGECYKNKFTPLKDDYVIAADGGYTYLKEHHIKPNLVVGDFDSLGFIPNNENIIKHPVMKDDTDMMLSVKMGLEKGYQTFIILGGLGGRLDHMLANIQVLSYLVKNDARGYLVSNNENITVIKDEISFTPETKGILSIFAHDTTVHGVIERGLKYTLENATITNTFPIGVSNEFIGEKSIVSVKEGALTVIWTGELDKTIVF